MSSDGVLGLGALLMAHALVVAGKTDGLATINVDHFFELAAKKLLLVLLGGSAGPESDAVAAFANVDDAAAYLRGNTEAFADKGEELRRKQVNSVALEWNKE